MQAIKSAIKNRLTLPDLLELDGWLQVQIEQAEQALQAPDDIPVKAGREVVKIERVGKRTYQHELIKCGKKNCRCVKGKGHGPYWYAYYWQGGRLKSEYIGKVRK